MAEGILFHVAGEILMKLGSQAFTRLGMTREVENELTKLRSTVSTIKDVLLDAEERRTKSHSLQNWLEKLDEALYDADDVLDELSGEALRRQVMTKGKYAKQVRIFFSKSNPIAFNYKIASQVKKVRERLVAIAVEKNQFHLCENYEQRIQYGSSDQTWMGKETCSLFPNQEEVFGRDDDKKKVKDCLLDMNMDVSFITIAGMGGIGKTTLAKFLFNDKEVSECFDLKIWVWVSDQFEVKVVVGKIIESATRRKPKVEGMEALQVKLQEVIGGKKYLLVMDDVWNESEEKWHDLKRLLMGGARGSKIMITKRDSKVATEIFESMTPVFTLKGLPEIDSWSLFRKVAFKEGKEPENPNLIKLGKEILVKCGGVPLAIRHIGRLLYSKTLEEWMSFKNNEVIQQDNETTSILKLSYNHLPPNLKQCFAYLSLFPKGERLKINELIGQWMAQGFIESSNGSKSMEDIGREYFKELCWRFFFENSSDECNFDDVVNMHDLMRDVARNVSGKKYVYGNPNGNHAIDEKTRHISFDHEITSWQDLLPKLRKAKGLRTFKLFSYDFKYVNFEINLVLDELFSSFPRLRVLCLKNLCIHKVPNSIKKLRHLRYLDLSEINLMKSLPNSITELQNLQTLNLAACTELTHMPEGMNKLSCLRTISYFVLDWKRSNVRSELNVLNYLNGKLKIIGLEQLRRTPSEVSLVNLKDIKGLQMLMLEWGLKGNDHEYEVDEGDETVLEGLQPHPDVKHLSIEGYSGVGLPSWVSTSLSNLTQIVISKCHRVQQLPQLGRLQSLQYLYLENMRSIKFIVKYEPWSCSFPSLERLRLYDMPNLEGWWELGESRIGDTLPIFPRLDFLHISHCPKLNSMPKLASTRVQAVFLDVGVQTVSMIGRLWVGLASLTLKEIKDLKYLEMQNLGSSIRLRHLNIDECSNLMSLPEWIGTLTSLETLVIRNCPKLKSLPEGMRQLTSLRIFYLQGCPELDERCKQGGEDWHKIAHIPQFQHNN